MLVKRVLCEYAVVAVTPGLKSRVGALTKRKRGRRRGRGRGRNGGWRNVGKGLEEVLHPSITLFCSNQGSRSGPFFYFEEFK